jgi:hypothetical protein
MYYLHKVTLPYKTKFKILLIYNFVGTSFSEIITSLQIYLF